MAETQSIKGALIVLFILALVIGISIGYVVRGPQKPATTTTPTTTQTTPPVTSPVTYTTTTQTSIISLFDIAEAIREGKINVGTEYGMEPGERFHNIHAKTLGLSCTMCHKGKEYPADYLYINFDRVYEEVNEGMPGVVDRSVCLACHKVGGPASTFYQSYYGPGMTSGVGG